MAQPVRVGELVPVLARLFRHQVELALRTVRLTEPQLAVLVFLAAGPSAGLPGDHLGPVAASGTDLVVLDERGLVERDGPDWIRITDAGRAFAGRAERLAAVVEDRALALLSGGEREVLRALLLRVIATLDRAVTESRAEQAGAEINSSAEGRRS